MPWAASCHQVRRCLCHTRLEWGLCAFVWSSSSWIIMSGTAPPPQGSTPYSHVTPRSQWVGRSFSLESQNTGSTGQGSWTRPLYDKPLQTQLLRWAGPVQQPPVAWCPGGSPIPPWDSKYPEASSETPTFKDWQMCPLPSPCGVAVLSPPGPGAQAGS